MHQKILLASLMGLLTLGTAHAGISIGTSTTSFFDISTTGTSVGTITDDSEHTIAGATHNWIGNGLFAGGTSIRIGNNGAIIWGNSATDTFTGATETGFYNAGPNNSVAGQQSIATMTASNTGTSGNGGGIRQFIAPLWDDYVPVSGGATSRVFWQVVGNNLIVQWHREDAFAATGSGDVTFQAIFYGNAVINNGDTLVDFVYNDTLFSPSQYQNDGGSATIGYKNWGINANANDVEFGIGGGGTSSTSDPAFGGLGMQPKVRGFAANGGDNSLPTGVAIRGLAPAAAPEPGSLALLGLVALPGVVLLRRRK